MVMEDIEEVVDGGYCCRVMALVEGHGAVAEAEGAGGRQGPRLCDGLPSEWQLDVFMVGQSAWRKSHSARRARVTIQYKEVKLLDSRV